MNLRDFAVFLCPFWGEFEGFGAESEGFGVSRVHFRANLRDFGSSCVHFGANLKDLGVESEGFLTPPCPL